MFTRIYSLLFTNRGSRQIVAKNTFWLTFSNFGGRLLRAIIIVYAARVLGAEEYGIFAYALSVAALLTIFVDFGIGPLLTREASKIGHDEKKRIQIISTSFYVRGVLLIVGALMIVFGTPLFTRIEEAVSLLPIVALIMILDSWRDFGLSIIRSMEKMEWEAFLYFLTNIGVVAAGFVFIYLYPSALGIAYGYALGVGIGTIATFYVLRKELRGILSNFDKRYVRLMFTAALPFAVSGILAGVMINTDILFIGYFRSAEEVGFYSAVLRIIQLLYLLPAVLAVSSFPLFARLAESDNHKFRSILERMLGIMFLAALPLALGGIITARPLTEVIFGAQYIPATPAFQVLLLTLLANFPAVILSNAVFAYNQQRALITFSVIGAISNVILDILFIPIFGILGSAWSTFGAQAVSNIYLWWRMKKINHFSIRTYVLQLLPSTLLMAIIVYFLTWLLGFHVLISIVLGAAAYLGFLAWQKNPLFEELRSILRPVF